MLSTSIKVGNRLYAVASLRDDVFDLILSQRNVHDLDVKSFVDYDDQVIIVRDRLTAAHKQELILHELVHACLYDSGIVNDEHAEQFVSALAPRLSCLFSEGLIDLLTKIV
jgi:Zn-dependent peptidase ImmA (M78 family)